MNFLPIRPRHGVRKEIRCLEGGTYQFDSVNLPGEEGGVDSVPPQTDRCLKKSE